jgi:Cu+-exporting ATPase
MKHSHGADAHAGHHQGAGETAASCCGGTHDATPAAVAIDPVCGMSVTIATAKHRFAYRGQDYFFCGKRCRERFEAEPEKFLQPKQPEPEAPAGTIYTCPMHPEVRQVGPGSCPICGMALEPEQISLDDAPDPELIDMTRRFWIALVLTLPVFVIEMGSHLGLMHLVPPEWSNWISFVLATPVVLWAGAPFLERGWKSIVTRHLNMFTLIAMGTGVAWLYSVVGTLAPQLFPPAFRDMHGMVAVYFEAAAVITYCSGRCSNCARANARRARSARCSASRRRPRGASQSMMTRMSRSTRLRLVISCAFAPARKFRSMASSPRDALLSMSPW